LPRCPLLPKADMTWCAADVRFWHIADINRAFPNVAF